MKLIKVNTKDLLRNCLDSSGFYRMDLVVKYMAIEAFYGDNDYGFRLYRKLYESKVADGRVKEFKKLIKSVEKNGFIPDERVPITVTGDVRPLDEGSHRIACCLYFGIKKIPVKPVKKQNDGWLCVKKGRRKIRRHLNAGREWLLKKGFTHNEIELVTKSYLPKLISHEQV